MNKQQRKDFIKEGALRKLEIIKEAIESDNLEALSFQFIKDGELSVGCIADNNAVVVGMLEVHKKDLLG